MSRRFTGTDFNGASVNAAVNQAHSVCGWVRVVNAGGIGLDLVYMDDSGGANPNNSVFIGAQDATHWIFAENNGTNYLFNPAITNNAWTHLALTNDGTNCRSYINGALQNTGAYAPGGSRANMNFCSVGFGTDFTAQDLMVFTGYALSAEDILSIMRRRKPQKAPSTGLYLWWPLHNDSPTRDFSGNGHTLSSTAGDATGVEQAPADWAPDNPTLLRVFLNTSSGAVVGASDVHSAATGNLSQADALVGTSAIHQAASGALNVAAALTGQSDVHSAATANLSALIALVGASGIASAANGNLSLAAALVGASGIQTAATGSLVQGAVSGQSDVHSAASANLDVSALLAAASAIHSAANGNLSQADALVAAAGVQSAASGTLTVNQLFQLIGASGIQSAASGTLTVGPGIALTGASGIASAASANLSVRADVAGASAVHSAATGVPTGAVALVAGASGVKSAASAEMTVQFIQNEPCVVRLPWNEWPSPRRRR